MNPYSHGFSCASAMTGGEQTELCGPLARLKREHGPLREQMNEFAQLAAFFGKDDDIADWSMLLSELRAKVQAFAERLEPHSELEEGVLFPMMANHIGRETGPIAVMEYEHDRAKENLRKFLELSVPGEAPVLSSQAAGIAIYAAAAHEILTDHFLKEENILFPMAENLLSPEEKNLLAERFGMDHL